MLEDKHLYHQIGSLALHKHTSWKPSAFIWLVQRTVDTRLLIVRDVTNPRFAQPDHWKFNRNYCRTIQ